MQDTSWALNTTEQSRIYLVDQTGPFNMDVLNEYQIIEREQTQNDDDRMMWFLVCLSLVYYLDLNIC